MPLIDCPECGKRVSDRAATCPDCGCPIAPAEVQTIEKTGKKYKAAEIIGLSILFVGVFIGCAGHLRNSEGGGIPGLMIALVGLVIWVWGGLGAWWHHG